MLAYFNVFCRVNGDTSGRVVSTFSEIRTEAGRKRTCDIPVVSKS